MDSLTSTCPVPTEQQPINEYTELKESWFYRWATLNWQGFLIPFVWLWGLSWFLSGPIAATSFSPHKYPVQFGIAASLGAFVMPGLTLLRLYLGWVYVRDRLSQDKIFYEESGWYDGQIWLKPAEVVVRDRLIVTHQIQPILQRLHRTFGVLALITVSGIIIWLCQ
ncbi:MAG: CGLD27 family protein [Leptolyngbyaceae cyanobacterium bins.59]|nr:CGLD27 family protein [Leptolyngbyaceae cyanobacterium bins.59]